MNATFWRRSFVATVGALTLTSCQYYFESASASARVELPFGDHVDTGIDSFDAALTNDLTELWHVDDRKPYRLALHVRPTAVAPFAPAVPTFMPIQGTNDVDPAFANDDKLLAFASDRNGGFAIYTSSRISTNAMFVGDRGWKILIDNFKGFDMGADGKSVFVATATALDIWRRPSLDEEFKAIESRSIVGAQNAEYPSVAFDEQEILFTEQGDTYHATLSADGKRYENKTLLKVDPTECTHIVDADFTADAMTIAYTCDGKIHIAHR